MGLYKNLRGGEPVSNTIGLVFCLQMVAGFCIPHLNKPVIFILSLLGLLLVTLLTVGYEIWKSVRANPVIALRIE